MQGYLILPKINEEIKPSWFGYLISVKEGVNITKQGLVEYLESHGIGTRQLFAGNILRQPMIVENDINLRIGNSELLNAKELTEEHYAVLPGTEFIMNHTFWVGVAQNNTPEDMKKTSKVIHEFVENNK